MTKSISLCSIMQPNHKNATFQFYDLYSLSTSLVLRRCSTIHGVHFIRRFSQRFYGSKLDFATRSFCSSLAHIILIAIGHDSGHNSIEKIKTANDALHFVTCDLNGRAVCAYGQAYRQYRPLNAEKFY